MLVETATKCFATAALDAKLRRTSQARAVAALVIVSSVVKVLDETMNSVSAGVQVVRRLAEIGAIDIGDEAESHRPVAERAQRAIGHLRPR